MRSYECRENFTLLQSTKENVPGARSTWTLATDFGSMRERFGRTLYLVGAVVLIWRVGGGGGDTQSSILCTANLSMAGFSHLVRCGVIGCVGEGQSADDFVLV